jgi:menaquinol-cytochrome c reductase iron-sulfur subunit
VSQQTTPEYPDRRRFLGRVTNGILAAITGVVGVVLGGAIVSPRFGARGSSWLPAGALADLLENEPKPVTLRVARQDGYREVVDRRTIFLVKTGDSDVIALDSTCTHLGCRVSWDPEARKLKCPCHGGVYDANGAVEAGPPPAPLAMVTARVEDDKVLVQI